MKKIHRRLNTELRINGNGDLLMASPAMGRLSMLSSFGELLFDRYVVENTVTQFQAVTLSGPTARRYSSVTAAKSSNWLTGYMSAIFGQ